MYRIIVFIPEKDQDQDLQDFYVTVWSGLEIDFGKELRNPALNSQLKGFKSSIKL